MYLCVAKRLKKLPVLLGYTKNLPQYATGLFGGEEETRTPAPVARPTPLAGAPRHQLEYFSIDN